jgi:hypothetical protein
MDFILTEKKWTFVFENREYPSTVIATDKRYVTKKVTRMADYPIQNI